MKTLVMLNPAAHRGRARERLADALSLITPPEVEIVETARDLITNARSIGTAIAEGTRRIVAAGGDGTVHAVVNALWSSSGGQPLPDVVLGAIGLGSSNDFHKPYTQQIPTRLDFEHPSPRDVVCVEFDDGAGWHERIFVASASIGVTAEANALFNREDRALRWLKRSMTDVAIPYAALKTMTTFRPHEAELHVADEELHVTVSNLSVLKTPYLSGDLHFDVRVATDDGQVAVTLCDGMSRLELVRTMVGLYRGRFQGRPKTRTWTARALSVQLTSPAALELDGELVRAHTARFQVHPRWLNVCGT